MNGYDVYRLTHETLCGRRMADFSLPRTIGYFANQQLAQSVMQDDIARRGKRPIKAMDWTTADDYRITPVLVITD